MTIHTYGPDGARGALHGGVESIEHPAGVPTRCSTSGQRGTCSTCQIDHNRYYRDNATMLGYPQAVPHSTRSSR